MHGKSKLKDHLEDLAKRHPELADQLKGWEDIERSSNIRKQFCRGRGAQETSGKVDDQRARQPTGGPSGAGPSTAPNLRATVPDMQAQQENMDQRNQRSQSAPPEGPAIKGAVSPQSDFNSTQQPTTENHQHQNNEHQSNQSTQLPQQQQNRSNERYIPIFVEGRGETIVNLPYQNDKTQQPTQTPPSRQKKSSGFQKTPTQPPPSASLPSSQPIPNVEPAPLPDQAISSPNPPRPPSPLTLVANILKEVEELRLRVEAFKGTKTEKEYIYLDEMLTRNLLKLDNIDSAGKDEVRAARKEVIRSIQQCINQLECAPNAP